MKPVMALFHWLRSLGRTKAVKQEIDEELRFHMERRTAENIAKGMSPEDASREARKRFGNVQSVREKCREVRGASFGEETWRDIRFGFRMLRKNPGFTAVAVLTLALGIGANTAIFSVVNALLFRQLPFRDPGRLVWIANTEPSNGGLSAVTSRVATFLDWQKQNQSFEELGAYFAFFDYGSYNLTGAGEPERLRGVGVSQNFLDVLGVRPQLGRGFSDEESVWNGRKAVLLTHGFWQRRFGGDAGIVGRSITLNNEPTEVVGVLPSSFDFSSVLSPGSKVEMLVPFPISPETDRWGNTLAVIGRLKLGATIKQAQAEFDVINQQLQQAHPERGTGHGARLTSLQKQVSGRFQRPFVVLFCAVGCVLLIACTNLSNLLLARAAARRKEMAVRVALGARRSQLIRQMLTESALLACCGAALGLPLAIGTTNLLAATRAYNIPLLQTVAVDQSALVFTLIIACATGLLFGIVPALQLSRSDVYGGLKEASRGSSEGTHRTWMRETLVVSEVTLTCVLLVGAALLIRSFQQLLDVDLGFRPENAVAWRIDSNRPFPNRAQRNNYYEQLVRQVEVLPGVEAVGLTDTLPLSRNRNWDVVAKGETYPQGNRPFAFPRIIDASYLRAMRIPLRGGRDINDRDTAESERVMLVNEAMARRLWPDRDAVGQVALLDNTECRVVGVVGNVRHSALEQEGAPEMYLPMPQWNVGSMELVVRTKLAAESLIPAVRPALKQIDPNLPTTDFQTLGQLVDQAVSPRRFIVALLGAFSLLALTLTSLGIYGVISYTVSQRTHEIGIRLAMGSPTAAVLRLIIGKGLKLALAGVAIGLVASLALTRVIKALLFGVSATDPLMFATTAVLLTAVALLACWLPARRATKVDPMQALRHE